MGRHWLYSTALQFSHGRGLAKLHGKVLILYACPIGALCLEYVPEIGVCRVMTEIGKWRSMSVDEVQAADAYLKNHESYMK